MSRYDILSQDLNDYKGTTKEHILIKENTSIRRKYDYSKAKKQRQYIWNRVIKDQ